MSPHKDWANQACDLEGQGRLEEAQQLSEANTTPDERARAQESFSKVAASLRTGLRSLHQQLQDIPRSALAEVGEITKRVREARKLPDAHLKKAPWTVIGRLTPAEGTHLWRHLPDPLIKRGRPVGSTIASPKSLAEMDRRTAAGEKPIAAALAIIGDVHWAKSKAKNLVRAWRKRCK